MQGINLLPNSKHGPSAATIGLGIAQLLLVMIIVGLVFATGWLQRTNRQLNSKLAEQQHVKSSLKKTLEHANELQLKYVTITDRKALVDQLDGQGMHYGELMHNITNATPASIQLVAISSQDGVTLAINATANQRSDITQFIDQLNAVKGISNVQLSQANTLGANVGFAVTASLTNTSSTASTSSATSTAGATP